MMKLSCLVLDETKVRTNASRFRAMSPRPLSVHFPCRHRHSYETTASATASLIRAAPARVSLITLIPQTMGTVNHASPFHFCHRPLREMPGAGPGCGDGNRGYRRGRPGAVPAREPNLILLVAKRHAACGNDGAVPGPRPAGNGRVGKVPVGLLPFCRSRPLSGRLV